MDNFFNNTSPKECDIPSQYLINFAERLEKEDYYMHGLLVFKGNNICMETYYAPYDRNTLHRLFSITKSFTSIAIGFLVDEGKIRLSDHIVDYFPEKLPKEGAYPYTKMLTIEQMLSMRTCHNRTTYKVNGMVDWVGSFFTTEPTHRPGTNFAYDTSSTHVLSALVEKLSGMPMLDYLRLKFLDQLGFSKDAFILTDPCGVSTGGSGLCATPYDIAKVLYVVAHKGEYNGKQLLPRDYITAAVTKHSDTYGRMQVIEEMQGYGYQFWCTRNNGFVMYGMGGQLALYLPDKDIMMVTTADVQARQGGVQAIYNAFYDEVYSKLDSEDARIALESDTVSTTLRLDKKLPCVPGVYSSPLLYKINNKKYIFDDNSHGFKDLCVSVDEDNKCGVLTYTIGADTHSLKFGMGYNEIQQFPGYNFKSAVSGAFRLDGTLLVIAQIIDSAIGRVYFVLNFTLDGQFMTAFLRKAEESFFNEYDAVISAERE
ncbi:MAG: serine hydrolase domain-containing protein [Lachnospira sp.]